MPVGQGRRFWRRTAVLAVVALAAWAADLPSFSPAAPAPDAPTAKPTVSVDFTRIVGDLAPGAFSGSISTYGSERGTIHTSEQQRDRLRELGLAMYRVPLQWNGGNVISSARGGPTHIPGDEWLEAIVAVGAEPVVVVGGAGDNGFTPEDAASLVRHINIDDGHRVTRWVLGNEPDNDGVGLSDYCELFNRTAAAMKAVDPIIKVAGPAWSHYDKGVLKRFLRCAGTTVDIIDYHHYAMGSSHRSNSRALAETGRWADEIAEIQGLLADEIPRRAGQVEIQVGEFGWSWRINNGYPGEYGDDRFYQSVATVWTASVAGHIAREGGRAHQYADQVGALGLTFERTSEASRYGRSIGDPMPIFRGLQMFSGSGLCDCADDLRPFGAQLVEASTTHRDTEVFASTGEKNVVLVNKRPTTTRRAAVELLGVSGGTVAVWQTDPNAPFDAPKLVDVVAVGPNPVPVVLPPYSVTTLVVREGR